MENALQSIMYTGTRYIPFWTKEHAVNATTDSSGCVQSSYNPGSHIMVYAFVDNQTNKYTNDYVVIPYMRNGNFAFLVLDRETNLPVKNKNVGRIRFGVKYYVDLIQ